MLVQFVSTETAEEWHKKLTKNISLPRLILYIYIISEGFLWNTTVLNSYSNLCPGLEMAWRFLEVRVPRFQENQHMKVVRLSALLTGHIYQPGNISGTYFCYRPGWRQGHSVAGRIMSTKNCNDTTSNRPATFWLIAQCLNQLCYHVLAPSTHGLMHSCSVILNCFTFLNTTLPTTVHKFITAREVKNNWYSKIVTFWDVMPSKSWHFHNVLNILISWDVIVCSRYYFWHIREM
jgi:hypothetical protein